MDFSCELADGIVLCPVEEGDAGPLAAAFQANRSHLAPWEPVRAEEFYTVEGQRGVIKRRQAERDAGTALSMVLKTDLVLHRLEAATLIHNAASQRVLEKNGFEAYGTARAYLRIAGKWQDHRIYQRIL